MFSKSFSIFITVHHHHHR